MGTSSGVEASLMKQTQETQGKMIMTETVHHIKKEIMETENEGEFENHTVVRRIANSDRICIRDVAGEPLDMTTNRMAGQPEEFLEELKAELRAILESTGDIQHREEFGLLQKLVQNRLDLTPESLLKVHRTQLEILVAIKTGMQAFLHPDIRLTQMILTEIFFHRRCRNIACQNLLPAEDCTCEFCSIKNGFCNLCMCLICSKFDFDANTCRWIGCDSCSHWAHTDCAIRVGQISMGISFKNGPGSSEMLFKCRACKRTSELLGWVKDVFQHCAPDWDRVALMKEFDCVRRIFHGSEDSRGLKVYWKSEELLDKIKNGVDEALVCKEMQQFFKDWLFLLRGGCKVCLQASWRCALRVDWQVVTFELMLVLNGMGQEEGLIRTFLMYLRARSSGSDQSLNSKVSCQASCRRRFSQQEEKAAFVAQRQQDRGVKREQCRLGDRFGEDKIYVFALSRCHFAINHPQPYCHQSRSLGQGILERGHESGIRAVGLATVAIVESSVLLLCVVNAGIVDLVQQMDENQQKNRICRCGVRLQVPQTQKSRLEISKFVRKDDGMDIRIKISPGQITHPKTYEELKLDSNGERFAWFPKTLWIDDHKSINHDDEQSVLSIDTMAFDLRGVNYDNPFVLTMGAKVINTRVCDLRVPKFGTMVVSKIAMGSCIPDVDMYRYLEEEGQRIKEILIGPEFQDLECLSWKVDDQGCVNFGGYLKVTGCSGSRGCLVVFSNIQTTREIRVIFGIPEQYQAGFMLEHAGIFDNRGNSDADWGKESIMELESTYLDQFEASNAAESSKVKAQKLLFQLKRVVEESPIGDLGCLNGVPTDEPLDIETELVLGFLKHHMLGSLVASLRKIHLESGLGDAIVGGRTQNKLVQPQFRIHVEELAEGGLIEALQFQSKMPQMKATSSLGRRVLTVLTEDGHMKEDGIIRSDEAVQVDDLMVADGEVEG
eukprot:Gb_40576 [translate_table: standard]